MIKNRYYRTTTDNPEILRLINGIMQVFDVKNNGSIVRIGLIKSISMTSRILKKFQKARHSLILKS